MHHGSVLLRIGADLLWATALCVEHTKCAMGAQMSAMSVYK